MMYKCQKCKTEFLSPSFVEETHGLDAPPYERWRVCPHCGSAEYFEMVSRDIRRIDVIEPLLIFKQSLVEMRQTAKQNDIDDVCLGLPELEEAFDDLILAVCGNEPHEVDEESFYVCLDSMTTDDLRRSVFEMIKGWIE